MKNFKILIVILLFPGFAFTQTVPALSLQHCIQLALQNSYRLQANQADIQAASEKAQFEKLRGVPKLSGELASESRLLKPYDFSQVWASVHADWSLGDYLLKTDRSARQHVETLKLFKAQTRLDAIGKVSSLYMAVLMNQKQKEIIQSRLRLMQQHYNLALSMWKAGLRTKMDVLQTQSEINKLQQDMVQLAITGDKLKQEMAQLMGMNNPSALRLQHINTEHLNPVQASDIDLSNNPLLGVYSSKMKAKKLEEQAIKARTYPHISLGGGFFNDADPTADGNFWRINAGISIPIYYGHENQHLTRMMNAQNQSIAATQNEIHRKMMIHLKQLTSKLSQLKKLMQLQQEQLTTARNTVDFSEINYKAGLITNLEFLTAQQQLTKVKLDIEATRLDYLTNLIEFYISTNHVDKIKALANADSQSN